VRKTLSASLAWAVGVLLLLIAAAAFGHDCSGPSDCEQTAGYNAVLSVIGGLTAVLSGVLGNALTGLMNRPPPAPDRPPWSELNRPSDDHVWDDKTGRWVRRDGRPDVPDTRRDKSRPEWSLMNRPHDDADWDEETQQWVHKSELQRRRMQREGYDYDAERDTYHPPGWVYDPGAEAYRPPDWEWDPDTKTLRKPPEFTPTEFDPEKGDASKPHIKPGWILPGDPGTDDKYETLYKNLEDRLKHMKDAENDALEKYRDVVKDLRKAEDDGDKWMAKKLEKVREDARKNLRRVQGDKLDLTHRVWSGSEGGDQYRKYEQKYRKEWTTGKVLSEAGQLVKEMVLPDMSWLQPIMKDAMDARRRLEASIHQQPELFKRHDQIVHDIKDTFKHMQEAQSKGDKAAFDALKSQLDGKRHQLRSLTDEMNGIHKDSLRWQTKATAATGAAAMAAQQIGGAAEMQMSLFKSTANYVKPQVTGRRVKLSEVMEPEWRARKARAEMDAGAGARGVGRDVEGPRGRVGEIEGPGGSRGRAGEIEARGGGKGGPEAEAPGGGGAGGGGPKQPKIPPEFADDYRAMQQALANGDEAGANRHATRMLYKDHNKFKGLVKSGDIDASTAQRAVNTHQKIVQTGVKNGLEKTRNMGNLLRAEEVHIDADGNMTVRSPVDKVYAPGRGMDPFDPANPRVPGDTDLTPTVDKALCRQRGLDPDAVQKTAARNIQDAINEAADAELGGKVPNYARRANVKTFEPGSPEEYHGTGAHDIKGRNIDSAGRVSRDQTTLGRELWEGSDNVDDIVNRSNTGRAMTAADESNQINKTVKDIEFRENVQKTVKDPALKRPVTEADHIDTAREIGKHHARTEQGTGWKPTDVDETRLPSKNAEGFRKTLDAAKSEDPTAIKSAVDEHYGGDYKKFYKDVQESSNQATQKQLEKGGKIWSKQADELKDAGLRVGDDNVVQHKPGVESREQYLERLGVKGDERARIKADRMKESWDGFVDETVRAEPGYSQRQQPKYEDMARKVEAGDDIATGPKDTGGEPASRADFEQAQQAKRAGEMRGEDIALQEEHAQPFRQDPQFKKLDKDMNKVWREAERERYLEVVEEKKDYLIKNEGYAPDDPNLQRDAEYYTNHDQEARTKGLYDKFRSKVDQKVDNGELGPTDYEKWEHYVSSERVPAGGGQAGQPAAPAGGTPAAPQSGTPAADYTGGVEDMRAPVSGGGTGHTGMEPGGTGAAEAPQPAPSIREQTQRPDSFLGRDVDFEPPTPSTE